MSAWEVLPPPPVVAAQRYQPRRTQRYSLVLTRAPRSIEPQAIPGPVIVFVSEEEHAGQKSWIRLQNGR